MRYNYIVFLCILNVLLNSCSNTKFILGTYNGKHSPGLFVFSEDSTFRYESRKGCYTESSGTWKKIGDGVYLNSIEQIDKIPIEYTKTKGNKENTIINVNVNVSDKPQRDYVCFPVVNGDVSSFYAMERGSYSIESEIPIDSIHFVITKQPFVLRGTGSYGCYEDVKTETIYPHLLLGENIDVTINIIDSLFGYKVFKNEELKIKGDNLIFKEGNKSYKLYLKK